MIKNFSSIIIPVRDELALTRRCLAAVTAGIDKRRETIVIDNGSRAPTRAFLRREASAKRIILKRNEKNKCYAASINQGMGIARGDVFVWLNNDALPGPDWISRLRCCLARNPRAGAAGPCTNDPLSGSGRGSRHMPPSASFPAFAAAWSMRFDGQAEAANRLSGFCFAVTRKAAQDTGPLDERFLWGEEDEDYCLRLRLAGYRLYLARDVFVRHDAGATRGKWLPLKERRIRKSNRALFGEKWGALDGPMRKDVRAVLRFLR